MPNGPEGTIALNEPAPHNYGDTLTFTTTTSKVRNPMIEVALYQDVGGGGPIGDPGDPDYVPDTPDGTVDETLVGPDLVFLQLDHSDATFTVGYNDGSTNTSIPAKGRAKLLDYAWRRGQETVTLLDSLDFDAVP